MKSRGIHLILSISLLALTACRPHGPGDAAPVLLLDGTGTSPNDVKAIEAILKDSRMVYSTVDSPRLDRMSGPQPMAHRLLIVPGGNYAGGRMPARPSPGRRGSIEHASLRLGSWLKLRSEDRLRFCLSNGTDASGPMPHDLSWHPKAVGRHGRDRGFRCVGLLNEGA